MKSSYITMTALINNAYLLCLLQTVLFLCRALIPLGCIWHKIQYCFWKIGYVVLVALYLHR